MRNVAAGWNHNSHCHRVILEAVPSGCRRALDVGCGEGTLTRQLRVLVPEVIGVDNHAESVAMARAHPDAGDIIYIEADVLAFDFPDESFGLITAVASLHHMNTEVALVRLKSLLRPGGVLAVVGLARSTAIDWPLDLAAVIPHRVRVLRDGCWEHPSPIVWPPPESYASMRRIATGVLPGARYRRRLFWRYTLIWVKPTPVS